MLIIKFGGTSVRDAQALSRAYDIVRKRLHQRPIVVVSALAGVTDALFTLAQDAAAGDFTTGFAALEQRHSNLARELGLTPSLLELPFRRLATVLSGLASLGELSPRALDQVVAYGERFSSNLIAAYFSRRGMRARAFATDDLGLLTDARHGEARPLEGIDGELRRKLVAVTEIPVVTGYIGRTVEGHVTTLGRHGSDYTAAILGRALRAEEIQVWTDVDGIMTADPRLVAKAQPLERLNFDVACEISRSGAHVLHPRTIQPAIDGGIPVRVLNARRPELPGTLIVKELDTEKRPITAIVHRRHVTLLYLDGLGIDTVLRAATDVLHRHHINIDLVVSSATAVSLVLSGNPALDEALQDLAPIANASVAHGRGAVAIIGPRVGTHDVIERALQVVRELGVDLSSVGMASGRRHLGLVLPKEDVPALVARLHQRLIEEDGA